MRFKKLIARQL